ncbi:putative hydrolase of the HAD superfamily [Allocatelliglobosispora scoriae]|uniref:Putative hydrolase of the HAD superfamily n=1 Tax=Allocatelliglobosispora scoriae TaxID=643052 RepID=A0A841C209_9ACTN|nr:HAD family hydrolase [Allocatelliglobosispora scoriae]MBB5873092.1 putative hydrolase of the HAD superfamily [Allocatelliglobosispora scoriae]
MPLLLLDLDNTLIDRLGAFRAWGSRFLAEIGAPDYDIDWLLDLDADGLTSRWDVAEGIRQRYDLLVSIVDLVEELYQGAIEYTKLDPMVGAALRIAEDAGWVPFIVTNGDVRQQEAKIRRTGLDRFVLDWVISEEVDCRKPNPRIFEIAAERARMRLRGAWVIGESPEADIGGAAGLGLPSIWIRRGREWREPRFAPTRAVNGVIQAVAAVMAAAPRR